MWLYYKRCFTNLGSLAQFGFVKKKTKIIRGLSESLITTPKCHYQARVFRGGHCWVRDWLINRLNLKFSRCSYDVGIHIGSNLSCGLEYLTLNHTRISLQLAGGALGFLF